jgi:hypothetical protein
MFTQGYIGITNNLNVRLRNHKSKKCNPHLTNAIQKYGWNNLIKEVILIAEEVYCLMFEAKLRAEDAVGWNIVKGGGKPPVSRWNKGIPALPHVIEAVRKANTGRVHTLEEKEKRVKHLIGRPMSDKAKETLKLFNINRIPSMKGKHFPKIICPHCNKEGGIIPMKRWHMDKCKFKENK